MKKIIIMFYCFICMNIMGSVLCQDTQNDSIICIHDISANLKDYYKKTYNTACAYAIKIAQTNKLRIDFFDVYYNLNDEPISCVFEYVYIKESKHQCLTFGISLNQKNLALEYYYFDAAIEKAWKETLKATTGQKIVICNSGTFLKKNEDEYIKYPDNQIYDKTFLLGTPEIIKRESYTPTKKSLSQPTSDIYSTKGFNNVNAREVILPGVPNYLWYLSCGLTTSTMIIGYWNDNGYNNFIPGGTRLDGHYWAVTEELSYLGSKDITVNAFIYYAQANEYGNNSQFDQNIFRRSSYNINEFWDLYVKLIDSTQNPLELIWQGPPYGPHATVGIGYKVDGDQRFLILNDTWRDVATYVNYDTYIESLSFISHSFPTMNKSADLNAGKGDITKSVSSISLESLYLNILPPLNPDEYAYHSFELADLNGDHLEDLIVCNFKNYSKGMYIYYNNGTTFIEDTKFNPKAELWESPGISHTFDFDNDGDLDIAITGINSDVDIFINEKDSIKRSPIIVDDRGLGFIGLECSDYDLDGDVDLISTSIYGQIKIYKNQDGTFLDDLIIDLGTQSYKVKLNDINNDNYPDLVASCRSGTVVLFYNNNGNFRATPDFSPSGHGGLSFDISDLNNDGWPDIVCSDDGNIIIYKNNSGFFTDNPQHINDNLDCFPKDITVTDLNNDNYPELIIANYNRPNIILENNNGQIDSIPVWQSAEVDPTINVRVFDNDKRERRLLFGKSRGGNLEFYKNNLSEYFLYVTPENLNVGNEAGSTAFKITSNTSWTVSDDADWLTVSPITGNGNGTITVTFIANPLAITSIGNIIISSPEISSRSVSVSQSRQLGVSDPDDIKLTVYPNPTKDYIVIKFDESIGADISVSVADALGKSYFLNEYKGNNPEKERTFDLTTLKSGFYFVIIKSKYAVKTCKIIKE